MYMYRYIVHLHVCNSWWYIHVHVHVVASYSAHYGSTLRCSSDSHLVHGGPAAHSCVLWSWAGHHLPAVCRGGSGWTHTCQTTWGREQAHTRVRTRVHVHVYCILTESSDNIVWHVQVQHVRSHVPVNTYMYCMTRTSTCTCTCTCKFSCVCNSRRCCHKVCTLIIHIVWKKIHLHMHSIYMYMYIVHANVYPLQALLLCIHLSIKHTYIKKLHIRIYMYCAVCIPTIWWKCIYTRAWCTC